MKMTLFLLAFSLAFSTCGQDADAALKKIAEAEPAVAEVPDVNLGDNGPTRIQGKVEVDKTVHDFGDVLVSDGPQACTFVVKNISDAPVAIYEVYSSCGCTGVDWTREPILPGRTGTIEATYKNEDGPYPFDKTLTVFFSFDVKKPVILRLRGVVHEKKVSLEERYGAHRFGALGIKETEIKIGNMEQGGMRSQVVYVANLGKSPLTVGFADVTDGLTVAVRPNPVPAGETASLTLTALSDRSRWGKQWYHFTPVVNGKQYGSLSAWTFTKEDFSNWSPEAIATGARPIFDESTFSFGIEKAGTVIEGKFTFANKGESPAVFYSADSDTPGVSVRIPGAIVPGQKADIGFSFDTAGLPKGETTVILTLTTNSPSRPLVNLFIVGILQ